MALQLSDSGGTISPFGGRPLGRPYYIRFPLRAIALVCTLKLVRMGDPRVAPTLTRLDRAETRLDHAEFPFGILSHFIG